VKLADLYKVYESLKECSVDVEEFSWGPTYEFANRRREDALNILHQEMVRRRRTKDVKGIDPT